MRQVSDSQVHVALPSVAAVSVDDPHRQKVEDYLRNIASNSLYVDRSSLLKSVFREHEYRVYSRQQEEEFFAMTESELLEERERDLLIQKRLTY